MLYRLLLKFWLLPPAVNILLVAVGLLLLRRRQRLGVAFILVGVASLWLLSVPIVSHSLLRSIELERGAFDLASFDVVASREEIAMPSVSVSAHSAPVIVVLGAGSRGFAEEYRAYDLDAAAAARVRYAIYLQRQSGWPVLMTGGGARVGRGGVILQPSQAEIMDAFARRHFQVGARWLERDSRTTEENAQFTARMLEAEGFNRIVLVTQSMHMRRSLMLFERTGLQVVPAATQLAESLDPDRVASWLPSSHALNLSRDVLHEYLGLAWYLLRG